MGNGDRYNAGMLWEAVLGWSADFWSLRERGWRKGRVPGEEGLDGEPSSLLRNGSGVVASLYGGWVRIGW